MENNQIQEELHEVVGYYLFQPIATLLEQIDNARPEIPNFHSVVYLVSSYSAAVIPLVTTLIDSFVDWSYFVLKKMKSNEHSVDIIKNEYNDTTLANKLNEIYTVRDTIVHAYIWRREINIDIESRNIDYGNFNLHEGYGEKRKRFNHVVNNTNAKTKMLGLSVIPTRINKTEVQIIIQVLLNLIQILEETAIKHFQKNVLNISGQRVIYQGQLMLSINMLRTFCGLEIV